MIRSFFQSIPKENGKWEISVREKKKMEREEKLKQVIVNKQGE